LGRKDSSAFRLLKVYTHLRAIDRRKTGSADWRPAWSRRPSRRWPHIGGRARVRRRLGPANAINASLDDKLAFDLMCDIAPVAGLTRAPGHAGASRRSGHDRAGGNAE
jgi:hypothetical protein